MKTITDEPLVMNCNKILVNPKDIWVELINIGFIENDDQFIAISRLAYEDEIYIEHNDQINCLTAHHDDVCFTLEDKCLVIEVTRPIAISNMPTTIRLTLNTTVGDLAEVLDALKAKTIEI